MSIIAPLAFIVLLLVVGFGYNNWGLSLTIFMMTSVFAILLGQSDLESIKANWNERRCELTVMVIAQLLKPTDDPRTGAEFAAENFQFCTRSLMVQFISMLLNPVYALIHQQLDATDAVADTFNRFRALQTSFMGGFMNILNPVFQRFKSTGTQFGITYQKFLSAMGRAFGITQAFLYIGMSLVLAVENFVHLVINVVMIIMYIILGLMILLWSFILPVFGLIIFTCQTIGNSQFGYLTEDVCGELCFDPDTPIMLHSGRRTTLGQLKQGDRLRDGTQIEGVLRVVGKEEPLFFLDGIKVSGAHLVWFEREWIPVAQHPSAQILFQKCPELVCFRTSTRTIPLQGLTQTWTFRDWEELPTGLPHTDTIWDFLVSEVLNEAPSRDPVPAEIPLLKPSTKVLYKTGEMRCLSEVQIGDTIYASSGFTTIRGIYKGEAEFSADSMHSDGIWFQPMGTSEWNHPPADSSPRTKEPGIHLVTESGCFWIQTNNLSGFVRDFTEVGAHNLFLTYNYTRKLLKKSFSREESCVSVSS